MFQYDATNRHYLAKWFIPIITFLIAVIPLHLRADIYKWLDEYGRIHYSDNPQSKNATKMTIKKTVTGSSGQQRQEKRQKLLDIYQEDREKRHAEREEQKKLKAERLANCNKFKKQLEGTRQAAFLFEETDDPYNPRILSAEERKQAEQVIEEAVKKWCD